MNGYLVFALVMTLQLVSPGTTHYSVDAILNGVLDSQYQVATDGSLSRFTRTGDTSGGYMTVERAAAFGEVYTVLPGPVMNADATAEQAKKSASAGGRETGGANVATSGRNGASTTSQVVSVLPESTQGQAAKKPTRLPPIAFSVGGILDALGQLSADESRTLTIEDPVQALVSALQMTAGNTAESGTKPAAGSQTSAGKQPTTAAMQSPASVPAKKTLSVTIARRGNISYIELPDQRLILAVHFSP